MPAIKSFLAIMLAAALIAFGPTATVRAQPVDPKPAPHFDGQPIEQAGPSADVYALKLKVPRGVWACATSAPSATATTTSCTQVTRPAGYVEDVLPVGRPWHFGRGLMVDEVVVVVPDGTKIGDVLK